MLKLARDYQALAISQEKLRRKQLDKVTDQYHDSTKLISLENVLRDVFELPKGFDEGVIEDIERKRLKQSKIRIKKRDLISLIQMESNHMTPHDLETAGRLIAATPGDDLSLSDVQGALTSPRAAASRGASTRSVSPGPVASRGASSLGPVAQVSDADKVYRALSIWRGTKLTTGQSTVKAKADLQRAIDSLTTRGQRETFKDALTKQQINPAYKREVLNASGLFNPDLGLGSK